MPAKNCAPSAGNNCGHQWYEQNHLFYKTVYEPEDHFLSAVTYRGQEFILHISVCHRFWIGQIWVISLVQEYRTLYGQCTCITFMKNSSEQNVLDVLILKAGLPRRLRVLQIEKPRERHFLKKNVCMTENSRTISMLF